MRHAISRSLALVAALLTASLTQPGVAKSQPAATTWLPAHLGSNSPAASFTISKWMDAKGTQKVAVSGGFTDVTVALNKPVAKLKALTELNGLKGKVTVNLAKVETGNPARNLNVSNAYFEAGKFATATVLLDQFRTVATPADRMHREQQADLVADGSISLHGVTRPLKGSQWHVAKAANGIQVATLAPIVIKSSDFSMPVAALLKLCNHLGIDDAAAVSVAVLLQP